MAALVALIASANVANLLLSRSAARAREVAVRLCVGGDRWRIMRQFLTESVVLALAGGAVGVLLAVWATNSIIAVFSSWRQPIVLDIALNLRVLGFAAAVSMTTGLLFGMVPALRATRLALSPTLKADGTGLGLTSKGPLLSRALIAGQVALCLVIIVFAALLAQTVHNLKTRPASAFLYGLSAHDPITFVTVSAILVAIMVAAAYLPARRAAHLDPMYALRAE
jgi:ABC-type antimicrobial peptide transport system permease subunit